MPGRVNTRFVLILVTTIAVIVLGLVAVYYLKIRGNPVQLARKGDVYMQEGAYDRAIDSYGGAVARDPNNLTYLDKFIEAVNVAPVDNNTVAERRLGQLLRAYQQKADAAVNNDKLLNDYYQKLLDLAHDLGYTALYQQLFSDANVKLDSRPNYVLAHKFRGIARVHLLLDRGDDFDQPRADQQQARDDLLMTLDHDPSDAQARYYLALWTLYDARYARYTNSNLDEIRRLRTEAIDLSQHMLAVDPNDPKLKLQHARILLTAAEDAQRDPQPDETRINDLQDQADKLISEVESQLLVDPQPVDRVLEAVGLIQMSDHEPVPATDDHRATTRGAQRAAKLLAAALDKQPDNIDYLVRYGILLMQTGDLDIARKALAQARQPGRVQPAVPALRTRNQQLVATIQLGNLLIAQRAATQDPAKIADLDKQVTDLIKEVETSFGRLPSLDQLEGKLRLVQGRAAESQQLLDKAVSESGDNDLNAMRLAAEASRQRGDWGDAASRLETILASVPNQTALRRELVSIYIQGDQLDNAQHHMDILLAGDDAKDPAVQMLHAGLLAAQGQTDQAIAILEPMAGSDNLFVDTTLARLYAAQGRTDDARNLLQARFDQTPDNLMLLQFLLRVTPDKDQRRQLIQQSRDAGADAALLDVLDRQLSDKPMTEQETRDLLLSMEKDPYNNAVMRARLLLQNGDMEGADKALTEAAALKPDDPGLLEMRFNLALQQKNWDQAGRFSDRARALNADLADGAFFRSRLAAAKGQWEQAVAEYEEALKQRPIFSDGWRRLGDARLQLNRIQPAMEAYHKALDQQPNNLAALNNLARLEAQQGLYADALSHAKEAWHIRPSNPQLREAYLQLEQAYGSPQTALEIRQKLAQVQPDNSDNLRAMAMLLANMNQGDKALDQINQLIAKDGPTGPNVSAKAMLLLKLGRGDEGEKVLADYNASLGNKLGGDDLVRLAQYRMRRGDVDGALQAFTQARSYDGPQMEYTRLLSDVLFEIDRVDQSLDMYRQLHENSPDDAVVTLRLCEALLRTGHRDEAAGLLKDLKVPAQYQSTMYLLQAMLALPAETPAGQAQPDAVSQNTSPEPNRAQKAEALRWVNLAIQSDANNAAAYIHRAMLMMNEPDHRTAAIADLNHALEINPRLMQARSLLVRIHLQHNEIDEAERELVQVLDQNPRDRDARLTLMNIYQSRGNNEQVNKLLDDTIKLMPQDPNWHMIKAQQAMRRGQLDVAVEQWAKVVELSPTPPHIAQYALVLLQAKKPTDAVNVMDKHAELANQDVQLQAIKARALAANHQDEQARNLFTNILTEANSKEAVNVIVRQIAAAYGPKNADVFLTTIKNVKEPMWLQLNRISLQLAQGQFDHVVKQLEAIGQDVPADKASQNQYLNMLAMGYYQTKQYEKARKAYDDLLKVFPNDIGALNNLAYLLIEQFNDTQEALSLVQQAADAAPDNNSVLDTLGWIQYKAGQLDQARRNLENSLMHGPLAPTCIHLAQVYMDLGLGNRASQQLNRALELADENHEPQYRQEAQRLLDKLNKPAADAQPR